MPMLPGQDSMAPPSKHSVQQALQALDDLLCEVRVVAQAGNFSCIVQEHQQLCGHCAMREEGGGGGGRERERSKR